MSDETNVFAADFSAGEAAAPDDAPPAADADDVIQADAEAVEPENIDPPTSDGAAAANKFAELDYKQIAQRTAAEFDNYRKRVTKERKDWQRDVLARFLKDFFPAFDDLDRVIAENEKNHAPKTIADGVKMARTNLWKILENAGVKEIQAKNKKFDPRYHEAIATAPFPDVPAGNVGDVIQAGYVIDELMLRPARVVVAAEPIKAADEA